MSGTEAALEPDSNWMTLYLRMLFSAVGIDTRDVDFTRAFVTTYWREAFEWDEESGEPDSFCIQLDWNSTSPTWPGQRPIWDGSYQGLRNIENASATEFLNTLASILKETIVSAPEPSAITEEQWVERYHRALLTHLEVDLDGVDLSEVSTTSAWNESWSYSEYTGGGAQFALTVMWRSKKPVHARSVPDWDGLFTHSRELTNEEVAEFLNSLTGP